MIIFLGKCNTDKCINNEEFKTGENEIAFQADLMLQEFEASAINDKCFTSTGNKKVDALKIYNLLYLALIFLVISLQ